MEGNLEFGLKAQGIPRRQRVQRITEMLQMVEMDACLRARPAELSGGQQQPYRLGLSARAATQGPADGRAAIESG